MSKERGWIEKLTKWSKLIDVGTVVTAVVAFNAGWISAETFNLVVALSVATFAGAEVIDRKFGRGKSKSFSKESKVVYQAAPAFA